MNEPFSRVEQTDAHDQHKQSNCNDAPAKESVSGECVNGLGDLPKSGEVVDRHIPRRVGPYMLGPKLNYSPIDSITMHLARHEETQEYVQLKVSAL